MFLFSATNEFSDKVDKRIHNTDLLYQQNVYCDITVKQGDEGDLSGVTCKLI